MTGAMVSRIKCLTWMANSYERDLVRRPCVQFLRAMESMHQLKRYPFGYWTSPPDLGFLKPHVAYQRKLDGYSKGDFDMTIIAANQDIVKVWLIEFKYGKNGYTKEQKAIADSCEGTPVEAIKIYSVDEFEAFVRDNL